MTPNPLAPARLAAAGDPQALPAHVWPASARRDDDGAIEVGGVALADLAARHGTPLYVLDEAEVRGRADRVVAAFRGAARPLGAQVHVYYAAKAFLSSHVARWMRDAGLRIDVATGGELALALAAGVPAARLGLHGNDKSDDELATAVEAGIGSIVLDSAEEVERVAVTARRAGTVQGVRLRVNSGVHASTHEYLATAREDQKFGVALTQVPAIVQAIRARPELRLLGLHSHIGSQILGVGGFAEAARRLLTVHRALLQGGEVPELNLGGGFGIAYTADQEAVPVEDLAIGIVGTVAATCAELGIPVPDLAIEPGRWIVGPAGVTVYTAGTVKDVELQTDEGPAVRRYVSVDGGMSDNARTALYGAEYEVRLANRRSSADPVLVRVVGRHCESGDVVVQADLLPADAGRGDLLAVPATGAYHHSLASNYNLITRPPVVAVADGAERVLITRETLADLFARDAGLEETE
ncbi:diaminopimelate decarboxylase [Amnibacterium kyonggiense]|uniref:Diaminopimelate decarboxylase n=1 Tax=Amnibacterium kyonggiense TaxID=595671 RepID=A0A4R7FEI9_9MICO|nr:diaminopimelate decarboxylase [Amnibacterium kyonggiense]TDS75783.1 diaminopimelate decarboxylase [Amnibacterium kyonggiense]